jgi:hypothetical protein
MSRSMLRHSNRPRWTGLTGTLVVAALAACADAPAGVGPTAPVFGDDIVTAETTMTSCGIGFWKNHVDSETWGPTGYSPDASVGTVFDEAEPHQNHTLSEALGLAGGPGVNGAKAILVRAAVGALLNAAHPDIDYGMSAGQVIEAVNAALDGRNRRTMLALAEELDLLNDGTCTTEPGGPGDPLLPDLIVERIVFTAADGGNHYWTATLKNVGTAPVDMDFVVVQAFYSADANLDLGVDAAAGGRVAAVNTWILEPGESMNVPWHSGTPGPEHNYLLVMVDYGDKIEESDETNNVGAALLPEEG